MGLSSVSVSPLISISSSFLVLFFKVISIRCFPPLQFCWIDVSVVIGYFSFLSIVAVGALKDVVFSCHSMATFGAQ